MTDSVISWLEAILGINQTLASKLLESLAAVLVLWLISLIVKRVVIQRIKDVRVRFQWQKITTYLAFALGIILVWPIWFQGLQPLATYLGLLSAGLAVALKDPITDIIGWAFILLRRPFEVGDRIQIGSFAGDVIDQRIFQFTLMEIGNWVAADQSTGRVLHVPNGMVFNNVLANYTKGSRYIWNEIPVLVTFESDWRAAKNILERIAHDHTEHIDQEAEASFKKASKQYLLRYGTLGSIVYTSVLDSGVMLTIRYLCEPRQRRTSSAKIWESILEEFALQPNIDFAYPTQRFYNYAVEGNPGDQKHRQEGQSEPGRF